MTTEEFLVFSRNHAGNCREIFSYVDATFHAVNKEYITIGIPALKLVMGEAYDNCIAYVTAMKDALDELE